MSSLRHAITYTRRRTRCHVNRPANPDQQQCQGDPGCESWDYNRAYDQMRKAIEGSDTFVPFDVVVDGQATVLLVKGANLTAAAVFTKEKKSTRVSVAMTPST